MTLDQIIDVHDEVIGEAEAHFPKPLGRHQFKNKPQLKIVTNPKVDTYYSEEYLQDRLGHFLKNIEKITME